MTVARNGKLINSDASNLTVTTEDAAFELVFNNDTYGWRILQSNRSFEWPHTKVIRKCPNEQIIDGTVTEDKLGTDVRHRLCTKWLIGNACRCSAGCCCLWTVPGCTRRVFFELWGAGGNGNGACPCNRCRHDLKRGGSSKSKKKKNGSPPPPHPTDVHIECAPRGVYRCLSRNCLACNGCIFHVCGYNACLTLHSWRTLCQMQTTATGQSIALVAGTVVLHLDVHR